MSVLETKRNRRVDQLQCFLAVFIHDLGEKHKFKSHTGLLELLHRTIALECLVKVRVSCLVISLICRNKPWDLVDLSLQERDNIDRVADRFYCGQCCLCFGQIFERVVNLRLDQLWLDEELFVLFALELISQFVEQLNGILVFFQFEVQVSKISLDLHTQERPFFLLAPLNDVVGKADQLLIASLLAFKSQVEQSTHDFSGLWFGEVDKQRQDIFLEGYKFVDEALVFEDAS